MICPTCNVETTYGYCSHVLGKGYAVHYGIGNTTEVWREANGYTWGVLLFRFHKLVKMDVEKIEKLLLLQ